MKFTRSPGRPPSIFKSRLLLIMVVFTITIVFSRFFIEGFRATSFEDIQLSIFNTISKNIIDQSKIAVTLNQDDLSLFVVNKRFREAETIVIGHAFDSDVKFIERLAEIYNINSYNLLKIEPDGVLDDCSLYFLKAPISEHFYKKLSSKYTRLSFNMQMKKYLNFLIPFSEIKTTYDDIEDNIIYVIRVPNLVVNPKRILIDVDKTTVLNVHYGKQTFSKELVEIAYLSKFRRSDRAYLKTQYESECVDSSGKVIQDYITKQSCESDYDNFGHLKTEKYQWIDRCNGDDDCKFFKKSRNIERGNCISGGKCELPLILNKKLLHYGEDQSDHAYENDLLERMELSLNPVLNI